MQRLLVLLVAALHAAPAAGSDADLRAQAASLFGRIVAPSGERGPREMLGRELFWDERLSLDGKTSCASCHHARDWGADRRRFPTDARGAPTSRHSPTVFNSMSQPALRWLGDRNDGTSQAESSLTGSMGFPSKEAGLELLGKLQYRDKFRAAFPQDAEPLSARNYAVALAAYQATLVTPAPFDRFIGGEDAALDGEQKEGLRLFIATGCVACHNGPLLGGTVTRRFGLFKDYWPETGSEKIDTGRQAITKKDEDRYVFRVPMLRNVAKTAPYFHDGSVDRLDRAVRIMASVQLGRALPDAEAAAIVRFLESLTGAVPAHYAPPGKTPTLD